MKNLLYVSLQKKYPGKVVAVSETKGKVVASGTTVIQLEKQLKHQGIDPTTCVFIGPIEKYQQISVY